MCVADELTLDRSEATRHERWYELFARGSTKPIVVRISSSSQADQHAFDELMEQALLLFPPSDDAGSLIADLLAKEARAQAQATTLFGQGSPV